VKARKLVLVLLALVAACAPRRPAPVVFLSDFGTTDDSVAICKGVMLGLEPRLRIVDLTHQVPAWSIADGARLLAGTAPYYGPRTVFLGVIDPGVGGSRRAVVVATQRDQFFVVPDNGLVTLVVERDGLREAREIANPGWLGAAHSATFHGRDVFSPVAARVARGDDWRTVGPVVTDLVRIQPDEARLDTHGAVGEVIALDGPYGNLVTNVPGDALGRLGYTPGDVVALVIGGRSFRLPLARTFGDVPAGAGLVYVDSRGRLAVALNRASFAERYRITPPVPLRITPRAH
jgi:S-adenosyl-L-methionine hydrolase (adenosine-forming)